MKRDILILGVAWALAVPAFAQAPPQTKPPAAPRAEQNSPRHLRQRDHRAGRRYREAPGTSRRRARRAAIRACNRNDGCRVACFMAAGRLA